MILLTEFCTDVKAEQKAGTTGADAFYAFKA
jgi:hypothetical protein